MTSDVGTVMFPPLPAFLHTYRRLFVKCAERRVLWSECLCSLTPKSYVQILALNVRVFGDGPFGR